MFILYDLIFFIFSLFYLPTFLFKLRQAESWQRLVGERFGHFSDAFLHVVHKKPVIWIHAVSVGEVNGIRAFYKQMVETYPLHHVLISTVTPTGNKVAEQVAPGRVFYFPFDYSWVTKRVIKKLRPSVIVLMETELWPNLILQAERRNVPVCVINGRLSPRSFRSYYRIKALVRGIVKHVSFFSAQTKRYQKRLIKVGVEPNRVWVTGNMKFDNVQIQPLDGAAVTKLKKELQMKESDRVIVAGSTHPMEEDLILHAFERLKKTDASVKLLIAPRHIERSEEILHLVKRYQLRGVYWTRREQSTSDNYDVMIVDVIGQLSALYAVGDIAITGGSFVRHGGQSPIEPAAQKKAIVYGPHVFNFKLIYEMLEREGAALKVSRSGHLFHTLQFLFHSVPERKEMGEKAFDLIQAQQGATAKNIQIIDSLLHQERLYHVLET